MGEVVQIRRPQSDWDSLRRQVARMRDRIEELEQERDDLLALVDPKMKTLPHVIGLTPAQDHLVWLVANGVRSRNRVRLLLSKHIQRADEYEMGRNSFDAILCIARRKLRGWGIHIKSAEGGKLVMDPVSKAIYQKLMEIGDA